MMKKRDKIIYWVTTLWLALGMTSTGIVQLIKMEEEIAMMTRIGYPEYISPLLGAWKLLGVIAILVPKLPIVKEWAYAGFFFNMSGAIFSHVVSGSETMELFGPTLLIVLTGVSWYFRPVSRKLAQNLVQS